MFGSNPLESSAKTVLVRHFALLERDGRVMGRRSIPTLEGLVVQNRMRNHDIHDFWGTFVFDKPAVLKKTFQQIVGSVWESSSMFLPQSWLDQRARGSAQISCDASTPFAVRCCQISSHHQNGMIPIMLMRWWSLEGAFQISPKQISNLNSAVAKTSVLFLYTNICLPRTLPPYFRGHSFHNSLPQRFRELSFQIRNVARNAFGFRDASANLGFNTPSAKACAELPRCGCGFSLPRGHLSLSPR